MTAPSITEFLLARIAEDEAYLSNDLNSYDSPHTSECNFPGDMTGWCDCGLRDKLLAECAAKRAIVGRVDVITGGKKTYQQRLKHNAIEDAVYVISRDILRDLATIYASHPDYRREWAL